jgi:hypothetical protein
MKSRWLRREGKWPLNSDIVAHVEDTYEQQMGRNGQIGAPAYTGGPRAFRVNFLIC